jgi:GMP synthase (glutamine-hydrolysing)
VAKQKIAGLKKEIGDKRVLLALSGGSDSATVAYLLKEALSGRKDQLRAVYIQGIDRPDDEEYVLKYFGDQDWLELKIVDQTDLFLEALKGKTAMHEKRVAMRGVYKACLEEEAALFGASYIAQGTLYTDVSESGGGYQTGARKAQIKLHHNVNLGFSFAELTPLMDCVKDSGRNIGRSIGVPEDLLVRHPFPGPGLVVRIEGEIDLSKLTIARKLDGIYIEELRRWGLYETVWQAGAVVTQSITTCTKGDDAATGIIVSLWAVWSVNGFTAQAAELPYDFLKHVSLRMTNEIREVGAVVYRISGKPPSTIEMG